MRNRLQNPSSPVSSLFEKRGEARYTWLKKAWTERRFVECQELLDRLKEPLSPEEITSLLYISRTPHKAQLFSPLNIEAYRSIRVQAMRLLVNSPLEDVAPVLTDLLFEDDEDIAQNALYLLQGFGHRATPWLLRRLTHVPTHSKESSPQGYLRILDLLGRLQDPSAVHLLDLVLQEKFPVPPFNTLKRDKAIMAAIILGGWGVPIANLYAEAPAVGITAIGVALFFYWLLQRWIPKILLFPLEQTRKANLCRRYREAALQALLKINDVASTPLLIEHLRKKTPTTFAIEVLQHHLAQVTPTTEGFTPEQIDYLNRLVSDAGSEFAKAALPTLEYFGNTHSLILVNRLAQFGATDALRREARRVLPILQSRIEKEREQRELLRASSTPADGANILLRSVRNIHEANPEQELLHIVPGAEQDS